MALLEEKFRITKLLEVKSGSFWNSDSLNEILSWLRSGRLKSHCSILGSSKSLPNAAICYNQTCRQKTNTKFYINQGKR